MFTISEHDKWQRGSDRLATLLIAGIVVVLAIAFYAAKILIERTLQ